MIPPKPEAFGAIRLVLLDIEGTTLPISFVRDVMFPYAAQALPAVLNDRTDPLVVQACADIALAYPDRNPLDVCREWMKQDEKAAPLKTLQGVAWRQGFADGTLVARLYGDVPDLLTQWHRGGIRLAVYSSGSVASQKLLYGHTAQGNLTNLFDHFFDLSTGNKKDQASYRTIAATCVLPPEDILFLSDIGTELDAATQAGLAVCQLVRIEDGTIPHPGVPQAGTLRDVAALFKLPE